MTYQSDPQADALERYDPAEAIAELFGSYRRLALAVGVETSTVQRWAMSRKARGCGGMIPMNRWDTVLLAAKRAGISLTRSELAATPIKRARSEIQ